MRLDRFRDIDEQMQDSKYRVVNKNGPLYVVDSLFGFGYLSQERGAAVGLYVPGDIPVIMEDTYLETGDRDWKPGDPLTIREIPFKSKKRRILIADYRFAINSKEGSGFNIQLDVPRSEILIRAVENRDPRMVLQTIRLAQKR